MGRRGRFVWARDEYGSTLSSFHFTDRSRFIPEGVEETSEMPKENYLAVKKNADVAVDFRSERCFFTFCYIHGRKGKVVFFYSFLVMIFFYLHFQY
jgi:hypothetical protein